MRESPKGDRVWHLGPVDEDNGYLFGRLGFEQKVDTDHWEEDVEDFTRGSIEKGAAAPFVIRLSDLVVVFQPRKQDIRAASFAAALRSMLRLGHTGREWRLEPVAGRRVTFSQWRGSVDVVTRLRVHLERVDQPPVFRSETARTLMEAGPDWATVIWQADGGLDTASRLVRELIGQVEDGFGDATASGRRADSPQTERRWDSVLGDEIAMTEIELGDDAEVDRDVLLR